jgi:hypothetical protein
MNVTRDAGRFALFAGFPAVPGGSLVKVFTGPVVEASEGRGAVTGASGIRGRGREGRAAVDGSRDSRPRTGLAPQDWDAEFEFALAEFISEHLILFPPPPGADLGDAARRSALALRRSARARRRGREHPRLELVR